MSAPPAGPEQAVRQRWTTVDGTATRYLEAGDGHPVLLIHGEGSVAEQWYDVLGGLPAGHRGIAVDLPGYGHTEPIAGASPQALAAFVWKFAQALDLERPALVGHSLGGEIAVHAALQQPGRTPVLVLVSPSGMGRVINPGAVVQAVTPLGDLTRRLIPVLPLGPALLVGVMAVFGSHRPWRISAPWWSSQIKAISTSDALGTALRSQRSMVGLLGQKNPVVGRLGELSARTLVIWGVQDRMVPFWQGIAARRRLRHGRLELVARSGHLLPLEAPDQLLKAMIPLLTTDSSTIRGGNLP